MNALVNEYSDGKRNENNGYEREKEIATGASKKKKQRVSKSLKNFSSVYVRVCVWCSLSSCSGAFDAIDSHTSESKLLLNCIEYGR